MKLNQRHLEGYHSQQSPIPGELPPPSYSTALTHPVQIFVTQKYVTLLHLTQQLT